MKKTHIPEFTGTLRQHVIYYVIKIIPKLRDFTLSNIKTCVCALRTEKLHTHTHTITALCVLGDARLVRQGFLGCLRDVLVKRTESGPFEEWEPLDWDSAQEREETYESWEGCPTHRDDGAHFLGQG